MIDIDVCKSLGAFKLNIAFQTPFKGVLGLVGPSGAGKSTLFSLIAGMTRPDAGHIIIDGLTLFDKTRGIDVPSARRQIGIVFQEGLLFPHMTVRANLLYGAQGSASRDFDRIVQVLGLENLLQRRPGSLSGGERQRVAIGRALLSGPRLLLLDEPLSALDGARKAEVLDYLDAVQASTRVPMIYISHASDEIRRVADRVVAIRDGQMVSMSAGPLGPQSDTASPVVGFVEGSEKG